MKLLNIVASVFLALATAMPPQIEAYSFHFKQLSHEKSANMEGPMSKDLAKLKDNELCTENAQCDSRCCYKKNKDGIAKCKSGDCSGLFR